jgi:hypothetical protein
MEQRRRLFFPGRRVCFVLSAFRLKRSLSLSLRLSALLGSRFRCRPSAPAARRGALPFVPVDIADAVHGAFGPGAPPGPPRRVVATYDLRSLRVPHTETAPTSTACTNCESTARRLASRRDERQACPCGSAAHTTTRATLAPHNAVPEGHPSTTRHGSP